MTAQEREQANKAYFDYLNSPEWHAIAQQRMEIDKYTCQCCGCVGTKQNPLECHHLSYAHLYHEESRVYEDLVTVCHLCHKALHKTLERVTNKDGRRGWKDNPRIPQVHVYNINGYIEHLEGGNRNYENSKH